VKGWKVALLMAFEVLSSSSKPMMDVRAVLFTS
jgi:hypothetical protein